MNNIKSEFHVIPGQLQCYGSTRIFKTVSSGTFVLLPRLLTFFLKTNINVILRPVLITGCKAAADGNQFCMIPCACPGQERDWFLELFFFVVFFFVVVKSKEPTFSELWSSLLSQIGWDLHNLEPVSVQEIRDDWLLHTGRGSMDMGNHNPLKPPHWPFILSCFPLVHSTQQPSDNVTHHLNLFSGMEASLQDCTLIELHFPVFPPGIWISSVICF